MKQGETELECRETGFRAHVKTKEPCDFGAETENHPSHLGFLHRERSICIYIV